MNKFADFMLDEDLRDVRDLAREFSDKEIAPIAAEMDRNHQFPEGLFEKL